MGREQQVRSRLGELADRIQGEMVRIGMWNPDLHVGEPPETLAPFGGDRLSFEQWLQVVFVPALRDVAAGGRPIPDGSQVHDKAVREWRMWGQLDGVDDLMRLLRQVDDLVIGLS